MKSAFSHKSNAWHTLTSLDLTRKQSFREWHMRNEDGSADELRCFEIFDFFKQAVNF